ncbi:MAG: hypothetical protein IBJ10_04690 [Phycisphaerales bacterium]|nr:hypothetical protein [Phycisphaerales bacterium]
MSVRAVALGLAACVVMVVAILAVVASSAAGREPAWWTLAAHDPATVGRLAERVENAVVSEIHRGREDGQEWSVALSPEQANAWIADRLPKWIDHGAGKHTEKPEVRVWFERGAVLVAARLGDRQRIVTATLRPWIDDDGALWARLDGVAIGRLSAPGGAAWAGERLAALAPADALGAEAPGADDQRLLAALSGRNALLDQPVIDLEDGRRVRLAGVRVEEDRLGLTWVTERR